MINKVFLLTLLHIEVSQLDMVMAPIAFILFYLRASPIDILIIYIVFILIFDYLHV